MEHADSDTNIKQSKSNHLGKLALICSPWNRTIVYRSQRFCPDTSFSLYHQENTPGAMENQTSCFQRFQLNFILSGSVHRRSFLCRQRQYRMSLYHSSRRRPRGYFLDVSCSFCRYGKQIWRNYPRPSLPGKK